MKALIAGLLTASAVVGFLAWRKSKALEQRGLTLAQALRADGSSTQAYLALRGAAAQEHLNAFGQEYATRRAREVAQTTVREIFPISNTQVQQLNAIALRLGVG